MIPSLRLTLMHNSKDWDLAIPFMSLLSMDQDSKIYLLKSLKTYPKMHMRNIPKGSRKGRKNTRKLKINVDKKWKKSSNNKKLSLT